MECLSSFKSWTNSILFECILVICYFRLHCDVCGSCQQVNTSQFQDLSEKYNIPDLDPRIRGLSRRQQRTKRSMGRMHGASKQMKCIEICVRYVILDITFTLITFV